MISNHTIPHARVGNPWETGRDLTRGDVGGGKVSFFDLVGVPKNSPAVESQSAAKPKSSSAGTIRMVLV